MPLYSTEFGVDRYYLYRSINFQFLIKRKGNLNPENIYGVRCAEFVAKIIISFKNKTDEVTPHRIYMYAAAVGTPLIVWHKFLAWNYSVAVDN